MNYLVASSAGEGVGLACAIARSNHNVSLVTASDAGEKIVNRYHSYEECLHFPADLVIFTAPGGSGFITEIEKRNLTCIGASVFSDRMYTDAGFHKKILELLDFSGAEQTAMSISGWWNGKDVILPTFNVADEWFLVGDMGPLTGSESMAVWPLEDKLPVSTDWLNIVGEKVLSRTNYRGPFTLPLDSKFQPTDILAGFAWPWTNVIGEALGDQFTRFLHDVAYGLDNGAKFKSRCAFGLHVTTPPYPYRLETSPCYFTYPSAAEKHVWLESVEGTIYNNEMGQVRTAYAAVDNGCGRLATVTASGFTKHEGRTSLHEARRRVMRTAANFELVQPVQPGLRLQYRMDAGAYAERVREQHFTTDACTA